MSFSKWQRSNAGLNRDRLNNIDSPRGGADPKAEYIETAFTKMRALKDSINEMMTDLMEFKERAAANDVTQKEIIQEQQERIEELEDNRDAGSGMK